MKGSNNMATPQNVVSSRSIIQKTIDDLKKDNETLRKQEEELKTQLSIAEARKVQSEHDKVQSIIDRNMMKTADGKIVEKPKMVEDAPNLYAAGLVSLNNMERVRNGLAPFNTYAEYVKDLTEPQPRQISITRPARPEPATDPVTPLKDLVQSSKISYTPKLAGGDVYQIISGGYYLGWNKSRCYIQKIGMKSNKSDTSSVNILIKCDTNHGEQIVMSIIPTAASVGDLTRAEVDNIIKSKPSYHDLFEIYSKFQNWDMVYLDLSKAVAVF